jgi:glycosyltransferase involved in cell wall biosynthesis
MPMSKKYLLIGAIPSSDPQSYGGATVLMQEMLNFYKANKKDYNFIQANKYSFRFSFVVNYISILWCFLKKIYSTDVVVLNVSRNGAFYLAPFLKILTKLFGKKFVFRMFGGDLLDRYNEKNMFIRKIADKTFISNSDLMLLETKFLVEYYKKINKNVLWFPNTRTQNIVPKIPRQFNKKFVFISQVKKEKGIDVIIKAAAELDGIEIDIYGPVVDVEYNDDYFSNSNVNYKGVLEPSKVTVILNQYDVLLLPTFFSGEGYPGIIIEAYSLGIPVISTKWKSIPEIVNSTSGILIEPKNSKALSEAIQSIDTKKYEDLSVGAYNVFANFDTNTVCSKILEYCETNL